MTSAVTGASGIPADVSGPVRAGTRELRWLVDRIGADVLDRDRDRRAPHAEYALLKRVRLGALRVPAELGGGGCSTTRFVDVKVEQADFFSGGSAPGQRAPYSATYAQLWLTSVIAGILKRLVLDAVDLVHGRSRSYYHAPAEHPAQDVILQETLGYISANAYVAEAAVLAAADRLEGAWAAIQAGTPDLDLSLAAALAAAKAKVAVDEIAQRTSSMLFDVGGATAARQSKQLDRHWRNIRTLASHNPRSYKAKWIGDHELNGTPLPTGAYF